MQTFKKNWPIFLCTLAIVSTLVFCTASITDALRRPRYGDAMDLMAIATSLEKTSDSVVAIDKSVKSIDGSLDRIAEQVVLNGITSNR